MARFEITYIGDQGDQDRFVDATAYVENGSFVDFYVRRDTGPQTWEHDTVLSVPKHSVAQIKRISTT